MSFIADAATIAMVLLVQEGIEVKPYLISMLTSLVVMAAIDAVWLTTMASRFYRPRIGHLMAATPNLAPAAVFYLIYTLGLAVLVVVPALQGHASLARVLLLGALYGFVTYATYDLTNQATLQGWPLSVTVVDMVWGALLTGVVGAASFSVARYFQ